MSAKLSRINQAYYLGVDEFFGRETNSDQLYLDKLNNVTPQSVRQVAAKYFRPENWISATAGKKAP